MKTKKNLVNQVLMSIVTAATVFGFTACSEDWLESEDYNAVPVKTAAPAKQNGPIGRTVLVYMAGKNNLTSENRNYLNEDLEEIKEGSRRLNDSDCLLVFVRRYLPDNNLETPWLARISNGEVTDSVSVADMGITKSDARACDPEVMKRIGYTWQTQKVWRIFYDDFKMTDEKFHGVSMFIPQDPALGKYARYNEDIKQMAWYNAIEG